MEEITDQKFPAKRKKKKFRGEELIKESSKQETPVFFVTKEDERIEIGEEVQLNPVVIEEQVPDEITMRAEEIEMKNIFLEMSEGIRIIKEFVSSKSGVKSVEKVELETSSEEDVNLKKEEVMHEKDPIIGTPVEPEKSVKDALVQKMPWWKLGLAAVVGAVMTIGGQKIWGSIGSEESTDSGALESEDRVIAYLSGGR